jgi:hypothetical protein
MTVKELIQVLNTFDPDLSVAYERWSEQCVLNATDLKVVNLCEARPDGWIQNPRPDKPTVPYLVFPG